MKKYLKVIAGIMVLILGFSACGQTDTVVSVKLDPGNPVNISVWHYYNGTQQVSFDHLLEKFNQTTGKEMGIYVEGHSQGNVSDLETKVLDAFNKVAGSEEPPDIFSSYADTAYTIEQMGVLVDLSTYMQQEELDSYVDSFVEEGRIGVNGEIRIFPVAKSTEVFMMNKTAWDTFAAATGASEADLATIEGVTKTAQSYYEWTDSLTPDVPNDGKAFYGRDALANLFIVGAKQLGMDIFNVENGQVTIQTEETAIRKIWDNYYVPYVMGWFSSYGRFRADDVKIGDIIAYTGSTASAVYFPDELEMDTALEPIDYTILPAPIFEDGEAYAVQQGAGMVITKSTPEREYASIVFLKWLTEEKNNFIFGCSSGYLPVKKSALDATKMDEIITSEQINVADKTYDTLLTCFEMVKDTKMYTNKAFANGVHARKVLEYNLADKAKADREAVLQRLNQGESLEAAVADYISDEAFQQWYAAFQEALVGAVQS